MSLPRSVGIEALGPSFYQALLQAVHDPTLAIDFTGTILLASDSSRDLFGLAASELVGRNIKEVMPEPYRSEHDGYLASYRKSGRTAILGRTRPFEIVDASGRTVPVELSVARADLPPGTGLLDDAIFIGSFRDTSERREAARRLEESERRMRAIFEGTFQYIGLLACDGTVLEANRTALEATGVERSDVIGHKFWDTRWWQASEQSRKQLRDAVRRAARGEFVRFETVHQGRDLEVLSVDFSLKPILGREGEVLGLIPEGRDISEVKRAQRAETAMLRALASIGESAAMLAHEIKNPITAVNLALKAVSHQLGEDHRAVLEDLVGRMQRLEKTMRRTLSFARPLELKLERVVLADLLNEVARDLRIEFVKRGTELTTGVEGPLELRADRQLLSEVLTNLVKNSLEARGKGGHVRVHARRAEELLFALEVEDDGPGIPESMRDTLFRPFVTYKHGGTGLGLAFCKKVIDEHGGSIRVDKGPLGGARFTILLPVA